MRALQHIRASVQGFTLYELVITMAIASILAVAALPGFFSTIERNRIVGQNNELLAAFGTARSEAIRRNAVAGVCARNAAGDACATDEWNRGWIVWADTNRNNVFNAGADEVLRSSELSAKDRLVGAQFNILFGPRGTHVEPGTGNVRTTDDVLELKPDACEAGLKNVRTITIRTTGIVGTVTSECT